MSESALAAATRPQSRASSTIGVKKSVVSTSARSSSSRSTAASSPSAAPTSRSPLAPPSPWPTVDISSSSAPSGSLQAQPAPWESEVRRIVPVSVMRCSVVGAGWSGGCRERLGCRGPPRRRSPWRAATFRIGLPPFQAVAVTSRAVEESVFAAILQDAWRQYRRRPLAVVLTVGLGVVQALLTLAGETVQLVIAVPLLVVSLMLELFLIAYLAGALGSGSPAAAASLATARRSFGPGVRAFLLKGVYALPAFLIGILLLGPGDTGPLPASEQAKFFVGLAPLFAFAWAFLAVLPQRVVLDNERRGLRGASVAHRVAAAHFPICLVIALIDAVSLMTAGLPTGLAGLAAITLGLALLEPFRIAMGNALFLRTRALHAVEPKARSGDQNRW